MYRSWHDLQRRYHMQGYKLIAYPAAEMPNDQWYITLGKGPLPFRLTFEEQFKLSSGDTGTSEVVQNQSLATFFQSGDDPPYIDYNEEAANGSPVTGIVMPQSSLVHLEMSDLKKWLSYIHLFTQHFPSAYFLRQIIQQRHDADLSDAERYDHYLWEAILSLLSFIRAVKDPDDRQHVLRQMSMVFSIPDLSERLPSEQLSYSLLQYIIRLLQSGDQTLTIPDDCHAEVRDYMTSYQRDLIDCSQHIQQDIPANQSYRDTIDLLKGPFLSVCKSDLILCKIQQLINLPEEAVNQLPIPEASLISLREWQSGSLIHRFQSMVNKKSIIDRIKSISLSQDQIKLPSYYPKLISTKEEAEHKWYNLPEELLYQLTDALRAEQAEANTPNDVFGSQIETRQQMLNQLTAPILRWDMIQDTVVPQWNISDHEIIAKSIQAYEEDRAAEAAEVDQLMAAVESIQKLKSINELDSIEEQLHDFQVAYYAERLQTEIENKRLHLTNQREFRLKKMLEYGITEELEPRFKKQDLYLTEMLKIEEEVRPYLLFVKQAFDSALPQDKDNFFNPYRHSIDGIEFDPETIQDVDKWMKGEVMKTINIKPVIHEAPQINCFAMDSSGSMKHEQMRNLFKMIYLIVIGLHGKASFDSFHFFGTDFISAAEFNHSFESKNLLYQILRKISFVDFKWDIMYAGEGGTHLSAAVDECHRRIIDFAKPYEEQEITHFKSLFIITDGRPSIGIVEPREMAAMIQQKRETHDVSIKGMYIGPEEDASSSFMEAVFGKDQYVEATDFETAVIDLVHIMTKTFKSQRQRLKQEKAKYKL